MSEATQSRNETSRKPAQARKAKLVLSLLERGRHHIVRREKVFYEGIWHTWPVVYLVSYDESGALQTSRVESVLDYFADHSSRSYRWMKNFSRAFGLLVDHSMQVYSSPSFEQWKGDRSLEKRLLRGFAHALLRGTIQMVDGRPTDVTGLYWRPLGEKQAGRLLSSITLFFRWLPDDPDLAAWTEAASTAKIARSPIVAMRLASELLIRKRSALLGHLAGKPKAPAHAFLNIVDAVAPNTGAVPTFPAKYVGDFLYRGFCDDDDRCDETAQLLAHLIFLLGLRKSEAFHLFVSDVQFVRSEPWIFFHHPRDGKVLKPDGSLVSRLEYLGEFGLLPRNIDQKRNHAGWKGMEGDDAGTPGYSLPVQILRDRTSVLLRRYLFETRPALMAQRTRFLPDHPFLLVSSGRTADVDGGEKGDPYTMTAFRHAWARAIRRVGMLHDDLSMMKPRKTSGTTPHGARHFYGRFLYTSGVDGPVIQRCMHHRGLESHKVYTRLTPREVNSILQNSGGQTAKPEPFGDLHAEFLDHMASAPRRPFHGRS